MAVRNTHADLVIQPVRLVEATPRQTVFPALEALISATEPINVWELALMDNMQLETSVLSAISTASPAPPVQPIVSHVERLQVEFLSIYTVLLVWLHAQLEITQILGQAHAMPVMAHAILAVDQLQLNAFLAQLAVLS